MINFLTRTRNCYLLIILFLLFFYIETYSQVFVHGDPIIFLEDVKSDIRKCIDHDQYSWLIQIGRPLSAEIDCQIFKNISGITDLNKFRLLTVFTIILSCLILFEILKRKDLTNIESTLISLIFFTIPGFIFYATIFNLSNMFCVLLSLYAYFLFDQSFQKKTLLKFKNLSFEYPNNLLLIIFCLYLSSIIYPTGIIFYLALHILDVFSYKNIKTLFNKISVSILYVTISLIGFVITNIDTKGNTGSNQLLNQQHNYSISLDLLEILSKLYNTIFTVIPGSLLPWYYNQEIKFNIIFYSILFIFSYLFIKKKNWLPFMIVICLIFITTAPFVISNLRLHNLFRLNFPITFLFIIFFYYTLHNYKSKKIKVIFLCSFAIIFTLPNYILLSKNIENTKIERNFIKNILDKNYSSKKNVILIKPDSFNGFGYNGYKTLNDEFFIKLIDRNQFTYFIFQSILKELKIKKNLYECDSMFVKCEKNNTNNFTFFIRDRIFINCVDDDNLLIDMNDAKIPNKINRKIKKDPTFCPKNQFLIYTPGDPKKMGISHAFDNKVDEKSFFETGIDEKPSIIIEFNNPVNYFTYEFFSGKSETRLPTKWVLEYFNNNEWVIFDVKSSNSWKKYSLKNFEVRTEKKFSKFRITFESVNSVDKTLRIYEIKINPNNKDNNKEQL